MHTSLDNLIARQIRLKLSLLDGLLFVFVKPNGDWGGKGFSAVLLRPAVVIDRDRSAIVFENRELVGHRRPLGIVTDCD